MRLSLTKALCGVQQQSIGTTWSVGGFLSIDTSDLAPVSVQMGFFFSFAETQTFGSSTGVSVTCGSSDAKGDFTCGLLISPACVRIRAGHLQPKLGLT